MLESQIPVVHMAVGKSVNNLRFLHSSVLPI